MTLKNVIVKAHNLIRYLIYLILDFIISQQKQTKSPNTLLLIKLDSIGDYILFRNFLSIIRKSHKFSNHKITLIGNIIWKDLAETFDYESVNNFIWLDRQKFNNNIFYKFIILNSIYKSGFEYVIDCAYSREILFGDSIVKTSRASIRIGSTGSQEDYVKWKRSLLTDKFYSKLILSSNKITFEFERNKDYFSKILEENLILQKPTLNVDKIQRFDFRKEYIVIFPGANDLKRRWSPEKFANVIIHILENYNFYVTIGGSKDDFTIAEEISKSVRSDRLMNYCGKTNLPQLARLISDAKLLISNDTSAVHFSAAVNTPFICISNGNHFGRFHPYPKETDVQGIIFYPEEIRNLILDEDYLKMKYGFGSDLDVNQVDESSVISALEKFLSKE